jgi:hypothetical protein
MAGITQELIDRISAELLECEQFKNNDTLKDFFNKNESLGQWCLTIPKADTIPTRVDAVIRYLIKECHSKTQRNALVLLLHTLSNLIGKEDKYHQRFIYLERPDIEDKCEQEILKIGGLLRIKAPRHMGKTDLKNQVLHRARKNGYLTIDLNLEMMDSESFNNLDIFLRCFCYETSKNLNDPSFNFPQQLEDYWGNNFSSKFQCRDYFQDRLLPKISSSALILSLDNVDILYKNSDLADDFFGMLRGWSGNLE